jgi:predicted nucleotidyltransferase
VRAAYDGKVTVPGLVVDVEELKAVCGRYGVSRLEVFGSASRSEATSGSDIDLLYELAPGARLGWDIEKLADELSDLFGRPVDLVSRASLHERLRDKVLAEARPLYAA